MAISVREMRPDEREIVFRLYGEAFGPGPLASFRNRYQWEFLDNPRAARTPSRMYVALDETGAIVGHIGSYPMLLKVADGELMTSSSGDLLVVASARGKGVGEALSKAYRDGAGVLATDGFGYQPVTGRIYRRLGYQEVMCVPICVRPLDLVGLYRFAAQSGRLPRLLRGRLMAAAGAVAGSVANLGVRALNRLRQPALPPDLIVAPLDSVGPEIDDLWRRVSPHFPLAFVRDQAFLRWRYVDDPISSHEMLAARRRDGVLEGFLVLSISEKPGMRLVRIMDLLCPPSRHDIVDALMHRLLERAEDAGAGAVICWGLHPTMRERVRRYLYLRPRGEQLPSLLYCTGDARIKDLVHDARQWHVTRADGDEGLQP